MAKKVFNFFSPWHLLEKGKKKKVFFFLLIWKKTVRLVWTGSHYLTRLKGINLNEDTEAATALMVWNTSHVFHGSI